MDISVHIGELVLEHECVIIPGLGAFLTNYHAADINPLQHRIQPPTRQLVFNAQLNSNDGLLAHYLTQRLDISYKTSMMLLEVFAKYCQRDLDEGKQIAFGDLGVLDRNNHHKIEFYPNTSINYNEDAFGLKQLPIKSIQRKSDFNLHAPIKSDRRLNNTKVIILNASALRKFAAVFIPIAFLISALFFLPSIVQNENIQQTSVFSFLDSLKQTIFSTDEVEDSQVEPFVKENIDLSDSENEIANTAAENEELADTSEFIIQEKIEEFPKGNYHIICGSFVELERAELMVNHLKAEGFRAYVAGQSQTGSYRVSMLSFENVEDASRQISWVRKQGYNKAWLLHKSF